jgi:GxxExxY protein
MKDKIIEKELSYQLTGIFFEIQKKHGRFCRERQYADVLDKALKEKGIDFQREYPIEVGGRKSNFVDFNIKGRVLVDLKAKPFIEKDDFYQMKRYLEASGLRLGLLVNFRDKHLKPRRVLNSKSKFVDSHQFVDLNRSNGQVMIISVVILGGMLLSAAAIAGLLMVYQIRASNDAVNSAKAVFAADAGIEAVTWCTFKPGCPWESDFEDAPFDFEDPGVTFKILRKELTASEFEVTSQGLASDGRVVRVLETIFVTD